MKELFHYVACGLPNVWLENGYEVHEGPRGRTFKIHKLEELHDAIGMAVVEKEEPLTGDEVRFLRTELSMSRKALGVNLGYSPETIKKWESGENSIQKSADILLRILYREYHNEDGPVRGLVEAVNDMEREERHKKDMKFKENAGEWIRDCA